VTKYCKTGKNTGEKVVKQCKKVVGKCVKKAGRREKGGEIGMISFEF